MVISFSCGGQWSAPPTDFCFCARVRGSPPSFVAGKLEVGGLSDPREGGGENFASTLEEKTRKINQGGTHWWSRRTQSYGTAGIFAALLWFPSLPPARWTRGVKKSPVKGSILGIPREPSAQYCSVTLSFDKPSDTSQLLLYQPRISGITGPLLRGAIGSW